MKSVILKGVEVKIGDSVRFIDDSKLYVDCDLIRPKIGGVYAVRKITSGSAGRPSFLLDEITNAEWFVEDGHGDVDMKEPGFAIWRFEPAKPLSDAISEVDSEKIKNVIEKLLEPLEEQLKTQKK